MRRSLLNAISRASGRKCHDGRTCYMPNAIFPGKSCGTRTAPVGTFPARGFITRLPDSDRFAYVANMGDDTISVVRTVPAGDDPDGIVFLPG